MKRRSVQRVYQRSRRGFSLVWFAMIFFGLLGLAALVIDVGLRSATYRQLQTATDTAALEGLRGSTESDAAGFLARMFDDDMNPANGDTQNIGGESLIELSGGIDIGDGFAASQLIEFEESHSYVNPSALQFPEQTATSVRAEIPSTVPYLFARGSLLSLARKSQGMSFTSSSKGRGGLVFQAGRSFAAHNLPGALSFVINAGDWTALPSGSPQKLMVESDGTISKDGLSIGFIWASPNATPRVLVGDSKLNGGPSADYVPQLFANLPNTEPYEGLGYVVIVDVSGNLANRVVGFGYVRVTPSNDADAFEVTKQIGVIAPRNVSGGVPADIDAMFRNEPNDTDFQALLLRMKEVAGLDPATAPNLSNCRVVLAPILSNASAN